MPSKAALPKSGQHFGSWTFISEIATGKWLCRCSCGLEKSVSRCHIVSGKSTSCGHDRASKTSEAITVHGASRSPDKVYSAWKNAKSRCYDPGNAKYNTYGARGITMYKPWKENFSKFRDYVGSPPSEKHTLGRINNDKGYEPGNLEWQTVKQQNRNKTNNFKITYKGKTQTLTDWAEELSMSRSVLAARLTKLQWPLEKALTTPTRHFTGSNR